jgi:hypothetical protein
MNTQSSLHRAAFLFILEFFGFLIVTFNMRAVAEINYVLTFVTDILIAVIGFTSIKQIIDAKTRLEQGAYALGGALGAQVALWLSSNYFTS